MSYRKPLEERLATTVGWIVGVALLALLAVQYLQWSDRSVRRNCHGKVITNSAGLATGCLEPLSRGH